MGNYLIANPHFRQWYIRQIGEYHTSNSPKLFVGERTNGFRVDQSSDHAGGVKNEDSHR